MSAKASGCQALPAAEGTNSWYFSTMAVTPSGPMARIWATIPFRNWAHSSPMAFMWVRCPRFSWSMREVIWKRGPRIQASISFCSSSDSFQSTTGRK